MSITFVRFATQFVASLGVAKVADDIIVATRLVQTPVQSVMSKIGGLVIGSMIADTTMNHVDDRINQILAWNEERKTKTDQDS
jgi:hypothetical protein